MKKVILSAAIIAGMVITANVQEVSAIQGQSSITMVLEDDGFVEVQLQDLSEVVQTAISAFGEEYEISALTYNAEKQLTKVALTKKEDQSAKTVYLDAEGKEVEAPAAEEATEEVETVEETPSAELSEVMQDSGFVNVKFDSLNEKVQQAVRTIAGSYDITSLRYNTEKRIAEVKGASKEDQSVKVFYLNEEGVELEQPAAQEEEKQEETKTETETQTETQTEEVPMSL